MFLLMHPVPSFGFLLLLMLFIYSWFKLILFPACLGAMRPYLLPSCGNVSNMQFSHPTAHDNIQISDFSYILFVLRSYYMVFSSRPFFFCFRLFFQALFSFLVEMLLLLSQFLNLDFIPLNLLYDLIYTSFFLIFISALLDLASGFL